MGNAGGIMQNSDADTETDRQNSQTGTVTGDDRRDRQGVRHLDHVIGHESARTVRNRQEGQTGTEGLRRTVTVTGPVVYPAAYPSAPLSLPETPSLQHIRILRLNQQQPTLSS